MLSLHMVPRIALFSANRWCLDVLTFLIKGFEQYYSNRDLRRTRASFTAFADSSNNNECHSTVMETKWIKSTVLTWVPFWGWLLTFSYCEVCNKSSTVNLDLELNQLSTLADKCQFSSLFFPILTSKLLNSPTLRVVNVHNNEMHLTSKRIKVIYHKVGLTSWVCWH